MTLTECFYCGEPAYGDELCAGCSFDDVERSWPVDSSPQEETP